MIPPMSWMNASKPVSDEVMFDVLSTMLPSATQVFDAEHADTSDGRRISDCHLSLDLSASLLD
jgi:hypothetical protein